MEDAQKKETAWSSIMPIIGDVPAPPNFHPTRGKWTKRYEYRDLNNNLLGYVLRFESKAGKKEIIPLTYCYCLSSGRKEWRYQMFPFPRPLYYRLYQNVDLLGYVLFVEGEKACDSSVVILGHKYICVTWPGGCKSINKADFSIVKGRDATIWPDFDLAGFTAAIELAAALESNGAESIKIVVPPSYVSPSWDLADALCDGWDKELAEDWIQNNSLPLEVFEQKINEFFDPLQPDRKKKVITNNNVSELVRDSHHHTAAREEDSEWSVAKKTFPKTDFPWEILSDELTYSFKILAKSCATSPNPIPTTAIVIFCSMLGATIRITPKENWFEPLIFWLANIQNSGEGKTPFSNLLCGPIFQLQKEAEERRNTEVPRGRETNKESAPTRPRSYFANSITLEGLRAEGACHGGILANFDELTAFIAGQNQFKGNKGDDREGWLRSWSGSPSRSIRVAQTNYVPYRPVSVLGGVPPAVWGLIFAGQNGLFVEDGTVYRFLSVMDDENVYELDSTPWNENQKKIWEGLLLKAKNWADSLAANPNWKSLDLKLDDEAQQYFFEWCNNLLRLRQRLPCQLRGFTKKGISYALRLTCGLHCMSHFLGSEGSPSRIVTVEGIKKGIKLVEFHLGHAVHAMMKLCETNRKNNIMSANGNMKHTKTEKIIETLKDLKKDVDNGKLAVGYIKERFEKTHNEPISYKELTRIIRNELTLIITDKKVSANNKRNIYALMWDKNTEDMLLDTNETIKSEINQVCETCNNKAIDVAKDEERYNLLATMKKIMQFCRFWISAK